MRNNFKAGFISMCVRNKNWRENNRENKGAYEIDLQVSLRNDRFVRDSVVFIQR